MAARRLELEFSAREARIVAALRRRLAVGSDVDVMRLALYRYAEFCEVPGLRLSDFELEAGKPRRKVAG